MVKAYEETDAYFQSILPGLELLEDALFISTATLKISGNRICYPDGRIRTVDKTLTTRTGVWFDIQPMSLLHPRVFSWLTKVVIDEEHNRVLKTKWELPLELIDLCPKSTNYYRSMTTGKGYEWTSGLVPYRGCSQAVQDLTESILNAVSGDSSLACIRANTDDGVEVFNNDGSRLLPIEVLSDKQLALALSICQSWDCPEVMWFSHGMSAIIGDFTGEVFTLRKQTSYKTLLMP